MTSRRWMLAAAGAVALGLSAIPFVSGRASEPGGPAVVPATAAIATCDGKNRKAPDFTLKDMHGKDVRLADYKGKVVLINFWATWCGPCKYEIPMFVDLQNRYAAQGLAFLGISVDDPHRHAAAVRRRIQDELPRAHRPRARRRAGLRTVRCSAFRSPSSSGATG